MKKKFSDLTYSEFVSLERHAVHPDPKNIQPFHLPWNPAPDDLVNKSNNLLDFGAGGNYKAGYFKDLCKNYFPVDSDTLVDTPYRSLDDIPADIKFDGIIANQVFEHMTPDEMYETLYEIHERTEVGGAIVITIPNVRKWYSYSRDLDHKTRLLPVHVCCFLSLVGFTPWQSFYYTKHPKDLGASLQNPFQRVLASFLYDLYGMHPADFVAIVGKKVSPGSLPTISSSKDS